MVVTTDNDLAPCLRRCRAAGIRVVVCGDYLPRPKRGAGAGRKTKAGRRSAAEDAGVGMTEAYWRELQTSQRDRPVGRLRLASEVDAALVWDGRRPFELEAADRDLLAEVLTEYGRGADGRGRAGTRRWKGTWWGCGGGTGGASGGGPTRIRSFPSDESKTITSHDSSRCWRYDDRAMAPPASARRAVDQLRHPRLTQRVSRRGRAGTLTSLSSL